MNGQSLEIQRVKVTDLITITRMAYDNMSGVDPQFTELVHHRLGRLGGYFFFPFYFWLTGEGYKAVLDGQTVGCAYLYMNKYSGYVFNVSVNLPFRRQGIACRLMEHLEGITENRQRHWLALQVDNSNLAAKRLYQQLGYRSYHPNFLRCEESSRLHQAVASGIALEPLNRSWGRRFFGRYQTIEQREGDEWAIKVLTEYQHKEQIGGRYWRCLINGEEVGAAWQSVTDTRATLHLAVKPEYWGHVGVCGLVKQLVDRLPVVDFRVDLYLGSSNHHRRAVSLLKGLGFMEMVQPRLLMLKEIR
jgi:ribosomal protein S18 acetylase RimI-like enzyme